MKFETVAQKATVEEMLALVLAVALGQCSKDVDCKGSRICVDGACVGDAPTIQATAPAIEALAAMAEADRMARVAKLRSELTELHTELEDTNVAAPIIKLVGATALAALAIISLNSWAIYLDCVDHNFSHCGEGTLSGAGTFLAGALSLTLFIWGGIQLRNRIAALHDLPIEIETRDQQLRALRVGGRN